MINEELLQFIREQRTARMETSELEHILISEGGWDQADIDEAYRALTVSAVVSTPPPIPTERLTMAAKIVPPVLSNDGATILSPASPMPPEPPLVKTNSNVRTNLDKLLPWAHEERMLAQTKLSHDEFPRLFSPKTGYIVDESAMEKESAVKPPGFAVKETSKGAPIVYPDIKTQKQSLENFFAMKNAAPISPRTKEQPSGGTLPHPFPTPIAGFAMPLPLKFDLAALRSKILPDKKVPLATLPTQEEAVTKNTSGSFIQAQEQSVDGKTRGTATVPVLDASPKEEKKKNVVFAKRTMFSDLLSREASFAPPSPPVIPVQEKVEMPAQEMMNNKNDKDGGMTSPTVQSSTSPAASPTFEDGATREAKIKKMLKIALGGLFTLLILSGVVFAFLNFRTPNGSALLSTAFAQFFDVSSFAYKVQATTDLALSMVSGDTAKNGAVKFSLGIDGTLSSGRDGYGDGTHNVVFSGG
ncbi:MAG: hypothetical protein AAB869_02355, partial [Patescibacteria group bacterium]